MYILLFTQTPIPGGLDSTIIDSRIIPVTMHYCGYVGVLLVVVHDDITVVMLGYDWWLCMMINISIYHSGRILPDNYYC